MVTTQEVTQAYRYILGREPESDAAINRHLTVPSVAALRRRFLESSEFALLYAKREVQSHVEDCFPAMDLPPMCIDTVASPGELQALLDRIKAEWEGFGKDEPHWSVLTHDSYKKESLEQNKDKFFLSGCNVANIVRSFMERHGLSPDKFERCFELGCGVGRITLHLAPMFPKVIGADISRFHLEICTEELRRNSVSNVELICLTEVAAVQQLPSFDFFVSFIVLQHNPPPVMKLLLEVMLGKLSIGGIAIFQLPTYRTNYSFNLAEYLRNPSPLHMEMHVLPQSEMFSIITRSGCRVVEVREDGFASGRNSGSLSNTFFVQRVAD